MQNNNYITFQELRNLITFLVTQFPISELTFCFITMTARLIRSLTSHNFSRFRKRYSAVSSRSAMCYHDDTTNPTLYCVASTFGPLDSPKKKNDVIVFDLRSLCIGTGWKTGIAPLINVELKSVTNNSINTYQGVKKFWNSGFTGTI